MTIKLGDFLLTKEKQLFRVVDLYYDLFENETYYDVKSCINNLVYLKGIPKTSLQGVITVIPEEKITKTVKILYGIG